MTDDKFFERLRAGAGSLRHQPDEVTLARIRARILAHVEERPSVAQQLARWFRPLAGALSAAALAAAIAVALFLNSTQPTFGDNPVRVQVAGETLE
jgi:hypothetical protein